MADAQWIQHNNPAGFFLQHPAGWQVKLHPGPATIVESPDRQAFALIQAIGRLGAMSPATVITEGRFTMATLFPNAKASAIEPRPNGAVSGLFSFLTANGHPGQARISCFNFNGTGLIYAYASPAKDFAAIEPVLVRIVNSFGTPPAAPANASVASPPPAATTKPSAVPAATSPSNTEATTPVDGAPTAGVARATAGLKNAPPASASAIAPVGNPTPGVARQPTRATVSQPAGSASNVPSVVTYVKYTDPQSGAFTIDVPAGWQVRGGLAHPGLGDRRPWVEAASPDGIYLLAGDPGFPQSFCHYRDRPVGGPTQLAGGGVFLNLSPSAENVAEQYVRQVATRRLGPMTLGARRPRPDLVQLIRTGMEKLGMRIPRGFQIGAIETPFQISRNGVPAAGSLVTTCAFSGDYAMGLWTFWDGGTNLYIAPPALTATAEAVRLRMFTSYQNTPRMIQIVQQDEAMITSNSMAQNAQQWNWFAGQQAAHNSQVAMGDAIVNNYWQQQHANESMMRGWEHNQGVYDRLSAERSDATLDRQRLADDQMGKPYDAPAGFNHYWLDQQSGQVIGTNTSDPPDYSRNYTQLRKL